MSPAASPSASPNGHSQNGTTQPTQLVDPAGLLSQPATQSQNIPSFTSATPSSASGSQINGSIAQNTAAPTDDDVAPVTSAHAERNPLQPTQPLRAPRVRRRLTEQEKTSAKVAREVKRVQHQALVEDIVSHMAEEERQLELIGDKHGYTAAYVKQLKTSSSHFKQRRAPTIQNAVFHLKATELNQGKIAQ